jgi:hypothetical protein
MDLFSQNTHSNMLPYEGEVIYLGSVFNRKEITSYYQKLLFLENTTLQKEK